MKDTMEASLAEATAAEEKAIADYKALMIAKKKEVDALQKSIEKKLKRIGDMGVELVNMMEDLEDTKKSLEEDRAFLADLEKNCATKEAEWAARQKVRAAEIVALADTIKLLNDDDALELFKKTLPSPAGASLLQVQLKSKLVQKQALNALKSASKDPRLDLIALALHGKKVNFEKVIVMIDDMVALLGKEQKDDEEKKEYCETEFDTAEDEKKRLARAISDLEKAIEENTAAVETLTTEIADLVQGIKDLDKQVAEATEQRKAEHEDFVANLASNNAAKDLLTIARNRLNKFYNPKLYKPPPKRVLSEEDQIVVNMGGTLAPTAAPGGIAGTGVTVLADVSAHNAAKVAPPPPPETAAAFSKKSEESNGVIGMIDLLVADLTKEMTEATTTEKDAQADYETTMKDSAEKRAEDTQTLANKQKAKAETEATMEANTEEKAATTKTLMATLEHIASLHGECDWLLQYFEVRKEARAGEVESLKNAKAVLSGADFSLLETGRSLRGQQ
jgi:chromosome segregation ATPase